MMVLVGDMQTGAAIAKANGWEVVSKARAVWKRANGEEVRIVPEQERARGLDCDVIYIQR